ncbi:hypothetical protein [Paraburkholderia aspalathi]|uniref:Uncharacterized protein n=1 Tax=Paraburkholderia aspalathi TaxID=1324617 RepID=A0A1I7EJ68_9BURK|nr:hypothetical protein [Paraburkholderia aspalathi]SFU23983.1 hypothetical protein SAMN05192563_102453 [Paraburkholderia aspalathi]
MAATVPIVLFVVVAACYAHYAIPKFTRGAMQRVVAHAVLLLVGVACGAASMWTTGLGGPGPAAPRWLVFVIAFGTVHVPAAAILFIKQLRGSAQS